MEVRIFKLDYLNPGYIFRPSEVWRHYLYITVVIITFYNRNNVLCKSKQI